MLRRSRLKIKCCRRRARDEGGIYLLEVLVALTVGAMLSFTLLHMLSSSMVTMTTSSNDAYANEILDGLMEHTRAYGYDRLQRYMGDNVLLLNKADPGIIGPDIDKRPVLLDLVLKQWQDKSKSAAFEGKADQEKMKVVYSVAAGPTVDSLTVTMSVAWMDSQGQQSMRTRQRSITLFDN